MYCLGSPLRFGLCIQNNFYYPFDCEYLKFDNAECRILLKTLCVFLIIKNKYVQDVNKDIWAANGYVNALITINYQQNKTFSMNTYYSEEDIDVANNTLNLNLYYNSNSENPSAQGQSVFSFRLPEEVIYNNHFSTDSITLVLNAISGYDNSQFNKVGECKVAMKDFSEPMF